MHAQLIVTNLPSKDSVAGLAIFEEEELKTVIVTAQFVNRVGKLGILRAVRGESQESFLDDSHLTAHTKQLFDDLCSMTAQRCQLVYRYEASSLDKC